MLRFLSFLTITILFACNSSSSESIAQNDPVDPDTTIKEEPLPYDTSFKTIHIHVALCDNKYQGIVPVPKRIGNGQDPNNNLYWGCGYGIRTYFKRSKEWKLVKTVKPDSILMERVIFKHTTKDFYLIADAYNGKYIKNCTIDFLESSCGQKKDTIKLNDSLSIGASGNSQMLAYIGHNGLMDFQLKQEIINTDSIRRDIIILACYSRNLFEPHLQNANVNPVVWSTHLMAPEAYTIHDAISGYVLGESNIKICRRAIKAYSKYQKCSEDAAGNLLVQGWTK